MRNGDVLGFLYILALSKYGVNCPRLGMKNGINFGVLGPVVLGGTSKKSV